MGKMILLYDNAADEGTLSGGSWVLPLSYLQDPRPSSKARSVNLTPESTTFNVALNTVRTFRALTFGPTNFTSSAHYRIRAYSDAEMTLEVYDSGNRDIGVQAVPSLDLPWENPNFWTGVEPIDDPDKAGIFVIHIFDGLVTGKYWRFDLEDAGNPDGYLEIGRLMMGTAWEPSENYSPDSNRLSFKTFTDVQLSLGGTRYTTRRRSARNFKFGFPVLPDDEILTDVYRIQAISNLDRQVFVIPDPDDIEHRNKRSFLGYFESLPSIGMFNEGLADTDFEITEAL